MPTPSRPVIQRCRDDRGRPVVKVPLDRHGARWATLDAEDYDALPATLSNTWFLNRAGANREYVKAYAKDASGNLVLVARVVLKAGPKECIAYDTFDRTDLRRSNISRRRGGGAKRRDAALTVPPVDPWSKTSDLYASAR